MNGTTKRLGIALAVSLAVNLLAAGFLVSRALHLHRFPPPAPQGAPFDEGPFLGPRGLLGQAGSRNAPRVREVMRAHAGELRQGRAELHAKREAVEAALRAEPFDAAALERALGELRASTNAAQERMHAAMVDLAKKLPAEERRALAGRGRGRRGHMHGADAGMMR